MSMMMIVMLNKTQIGHLLLMILNQVLRVILAPSFSVYIGDLHNSGYGVCIGSLIAGVIAYADDICILSCSSYGLQKLLDICSAYGQKLDIRFNPVKSQLMTFGGSNSDNTTVYLDRKVVQWCTTVKYLGLYSVASRRLS